MAVFGPVLEDAEHSWSESPGGWELALDRTLSKTEMSAELTEIRMRCWYLPLALTLNGSAAGPNIGMELVDTFTMRRFYRKRDDLGFVPFAGNLSPAARVKQKLPSFGWKEQVSWPDGADQPLPTLLTSNKQEALLCSAVVLLGVNLDRPSRIQWVQHGVRMEPTELDLGFPGAWALVSANDLAAEGLTVVPGAARDRYVDWVRAEVRNLALEAQAFRHKSYPADFNPAARLLPLVGGIGTAFLLKAAWPVFVGGGAAQLYEWVKGRGWSRRFWSRVDEIAAATSVELPTAGSQRAAPEEDPS